MTVNHAHYMLNTNNGSDLIDFDDFQNAGEIDSVTAKNKIELDIDVKVNNGHSEVNGIIPCLLQFLVIKIAMVKVQIIDIKFGLKIIKRN